jgi:hypothetical protein
VPGDAFTLWASLLPLWLVTAALARGALVLAWRRAS